MFFKILYKFGWLIRRNRLKDPLTRHAIITLIPQTSTYDRR